MYVASLYFTQKHGKQYRKTILHCKKELDETKVFKPLLKIWNCDYLIKLGIITEILVFQLDFLVASEIPCLYIVCRFS